MKPKQVGLVLSSLIVLGIIAIIVRIIFSGDSAYVLEGLLPISEDVIDSVTIESTESSLTLYKIDVGAWEVEKYPAFEPKMGEFWQHVFDIEQAQLVARNPKHHQLLGVNQENSTKLNFFLGPSLQESFHIGKWSQDVRLCYIRKAGKDEVYGIPCPRGNVFSANSDAWRNPIVYSVPYSEIESFDFIYPDSQQNFSLILNDDMTWSARNNTSNQLANLTMLQYLFQAVQLIPAIGFAEEEISKLLDFDAPDGALRINTCETSNTPTTRLKFIKKDEVSYYVKLSSQSTVFIMDGQTAEFLMMDISDISVSE